MCWPVRVKSTDQPANSKSVLFQKFEHFWEMIAAYVPWGLYLLGVDVNLPPTPLPLLLLLSSTQPYKGKLCADKTSSAKRTVHCVPLLSYYKLKQLLKRKIQQPCLETTWSTCITTFFIHYIWRICCLMFCKINVYFFVYAESCVTCITVSV